MRTLDFGAGDCIYPVTALTGTVGISDTGLVTGTGTLFETQMANTQPAGTLNAQYVLIDGFVYEVQSVLSNTTMQLAQNTYVIVAAGKAILRVGTVFLYTKIIVASSGKIYGVMPSTEYTDAFPFIIEKEAGIPPFSFSGGVTCIVQ